MATWTNIPDSVLEPGKPARSVDALALRDNPIAIAEGAVGAPRVQTDGLANNAVTNEKIANMDAGKLNSGTVPGERIPTGHGGVGTYALVQRTGTLGLVGWGGTVAGSTLEVTAVNDLSSGGAILAGTWRVMSRHIGVTSGSGRAGIAVRIS